jgi:peptidoglycan/LPS O-acetylase OafA/YrhL
MLLPLLALTAVAILLGLAMRRVRDRALAVLGVVGFFLIAIPALFVSGGVVERIVAAVFAYSPYWEYVLPLLTFAVALLLPTKTQGGTSRRRSKEVFRAEKEYW